MAAGACLVLVPAAVPVAAGSATPAGTLRPAGSGECTYPATDIKGTPWSLQRVLLNQLWQDTKGRNVRVAVIDSGVDNRNPQLRQAVSAASGVSVIKGDNSHGTNDTMGHGTRVAGIIAARPSTDTGFVGLAPQATIVPVKQYAQQDPSVDQTPTLVQAVDAAISAHVQIINISEDTTSDYPPLRAAVARAVARNILVVASAGNEGAGGHLGTTYPAAYPGVLAVGASDRNNERADFSQAGTFVDVAAPGVDMVSTVPGGGQCVDQGTSFSAPYAAGVAALIKARHPRWGPAQITARIEQTAQRTSLGRNDFVGWGVVDPVRAVNDDSPPEPAATPDKGLTRSSSHVVPAAVTFGESRQAHDRRIATYVLGAGLLMVVVVSGGSIALRDVRRRTARAAEAGTGHGGDGRARGL
jgi:type VII secretion-associated serine protease mycosin